MNTTAIKKEESPKTKVILFGVIFLILAIAKEIQGSAPGQEINIDTDTWILVAIGVVLILFNTDLIKLLPKRLSSVTVGNVKIDLDTPKPAESAVENFVEQKVLTEEEETTRREDLRSYEKLIPGRYAPQYSIMNKVPKSQARLTEAMTFTTPMYALDADYRILDWNEAFSLAFDRSMDGLRGISVSEWSIKLKNYEDVVAHGVEVFKDPDNLPRVDIEVIEYENMVGNTVSALKRAYQVADDDGSCLGWLVLLELDFEHESQHLDYLRNLYHILGQDMMWSEYAISYDQVLLNTKRYIELLQVMMGAEAPYQPIPPHSKVLDLGAGTGNLAIHLLKRDPTLHVVCLEKNRTMLDLLRTNAEHEKLLTDDINNPGILPIKQDITVLNGIETGFFDYVLMNNVFYTLTEKAQGACLSEVYRVLKIGGEVRISGPHKKTNVSALFKVLWDELSSDNKNDTSFVRDFRNVEKINIDALEPILLGDDLETMRSKLQAAGFTQFGPTSDRVYAGHAVILNAIK